MPCCPAEAKTRCFSARILSLLKLRLDFRNCAESSAATSRVHVASMLNDEAGGDVRDCLYRSKTRRLVLEAIRDDSQP